MKTPVIIILSASVAVLCTLPALYLFLAYQTHKERKGWKTDYDRALRKLEAEGLRNPRPAVAARLNSTYSPTGPGRAPSAQQYYSHQHQNQRPRAPARPAPAYSPRAGPSASRRSRTRLSQADAAPGSRASARSSSSSGWRRRQEEEEQQQQQQQQQQIALNNLIFTSLAAQDNFF